MIQNRYKQIGVYLYPGILAGNNKINYTPNGVLDTNANLAEGSQ